MRARDLWVVQCKYTSSSPPPTSAVAEVVNAARFYGAQRLMVATSRPASEAFQQERRRYERAGLQVELAEPRLLIGWTRDTPEYSPTRRKLHAYQEDTASKLRNALLDTGRGQVVLATGLGKTVVMADVVADLLRDGLVPHSRVLVVAHTRELVSQLHLAFWHQLPKWVPTHQLSDGESPSYWEGITFATIQSIQSKLSTLPEFGLMLVDEAHHVGAETFRQVINSIKPNMLAGATATPWRGDGFDIDEILGPALVRIGIADGLQHGFLSEVDYRLFADNVDWSFVQRASKHHYSLSELNRHLIIPTRDEQAARTIREVFDREKRRGGIIYSPTISHAKMFAAMLRQYGFRSESLSSDDDPRHRAIVMARFRAGEIDLLATVDLFNEGVDVPDVDTIVFMRVTHSRRIFVQQLGRGLRISPTKSKVVVLDFVSDLRRVAEILELDRATRSEEIEKLGLGGRLIQFMDVSAGSFLKEWLLDQASLVLREDDPKLELPKIEFPNPLPPGGVQ